MKSLTEEQEECIKSIGKPLLVLAGPGTGKTEILSHRVLHLLKTDLATKDDIVGITFTTKAAKQMKERLRTLGLEYENQPLICTLHSLAVRMLKNYGAEIKIWEDFLIADSYEAKLLLGDAISFIEPLAIKKLEMWSNKILLLKAEKKRPTDTTGLLRKIYERYQRLLQFHHALDFKDLIIQACNLLEVSEKAKDLYFARSKHLLVDEFQDINRAEYSLIKHLAGLGIGLFVVGDDNQSIYGWRGGDPKIILGFKSDFKDAVQKPMTICFRCPENIIKGADEFIKREPKLKPQMKSTEPIYILDC